MKKISLITIIFFISIQIVEGQIKNGSFENWHATSSISNTENPDFWTSTNILDSTNIGIFKSTDAYEGNYALKMIPKKYIYNGITSVAYGVTNPTTFVGHGFYTKDTISFVPSKLAGYYKRIKTNYVDNDTAFIWVALNRTGDPITGISGYGDLGFLPTTNYQYFEVNIISDPIADSIGIFILYESDDTSLNNGGYLLIDDLSLEPTVSSTELIDVQIKIYPNPVSDYLYFEYGEKVNVKSVELFNLEGKLVKLVENIPQQLDVRDIQKGYHIIRITSDYGVGTKKILIK